MPGNTDIPCMDLEDRPLLHTPDLMLALLKSAQDHAATLGDAARLLVRSLAQAHEPQKVDEVELATLLDRARRHLVAAQLLDMLGDGSFRITPRGRSVLSRHPGGVDDSVLMEFPEFRAWMHRVTDHPPPELANSREFQGGWYARQEGGDLGENPFSPDTAQHAAWEDGWLEAQRQWGGND